MNIKIIKIVDHLGKEIGAILTYLENKPLIGKEKEKVEERLKDYAVNELYPSEGLLLYKEVNDDIAAITVFKDIENLEQNTINI